SECSNSINTINSTVQNLDAKSLRIPSELVGQIDTELKNLQPRQYVVVNEDASGFSTVEGGGGEGGKKGEILVKKSDANFDTTWIDPRAILKKAPTVKETISDVQLQNNVTMILNDSVESESIDDVPRHGLTQRQINSDTSADSSYTYILCDEIDDSAEDESDIATREKFGRVKIGSGINVNNGEISMPVIGVATENDFGTVKIGEGLAVNDGVVSTLPYRHADHENFGIIKPSADFNFDSRGALQLANRSEDIIYQKAAKNIVEDGVIKIVSTCAYYRAFINTDTLFSFDWNNFTPKADISFDLEIISDGTYVVNFGSDVIWDLPCAGVNLGTTIIHFEKLMGESQFRGTLKSAALNKIKLLTSDTSADITDNYICSHNGCGWQACYCMAVKDYSNYMNFYNPTDGIWYIDFKRSTYVEYLQYVQGFDNWTAEYFYIEGSVDRKNWKRLLTRENVKPTTYTLDEHGFFKHYRIRCKNTQIRYFRWYGFDVEDERYELQRVMPIMQSNSANGFEITSSGVTSGNLYNLTNDSISSWANFETRLNGEFWVKYELAEPQSVDMIDLAARFGAESDRMPTWFRIEGSNDDENWETVFERAFLTRWYQGESRQYWIYNQTPYKFYRLLSLEQPTANFSLSRFRLYKKIDGTAPRGFVPILSSASQGGYEVSASSTCGSDHWPYLAFDGKSGTKWASANGDAVGGWIQIKFPTAILCTTAWLTARNDDWFGQAATDFTILGSVDGENFETIKTVTSQTWTKGEQKKITFFNEISYLYYRVQAQTIQNGQGYFAFSEVNFGTEIREYKRELNAYRRLTPIMTANSQDGFILTANSIYSGAKVYNPFEAFNNTVSDASSWTTKTQSGWIQIELPEADKANMFRMSGGFSNEEPNSFILYGSNDGENYDELLNSGSLTWTHNETKTWDLNHDTAYKFYKVEAVNTKSAYITISEIQLIEHITTREY
ncbi:MAG: discoidin domain-containing protein, partial [Alphaproteobacteria bacterium]|nr:discoidin domain-containing protein [Alphaproteobacteria bacterium]